MQIIDGKTLQVVATIKTGKAGASVAVNADGDRYVVGDGIEETLTELTAPDLAAVISWT
jgi:hypothetical protein